MIYIQKKDNDRLHVSLGLGFLLLLPTRWSYEYLLLAGYSGLLPYPETQLGVAVGVCACGHAVFGRGADRSLSLVSRTLTAAHLWAPASGESLLSANK